MSTDGRIWEILPPPSDGHPNENILLDAEVALQDIFNLSKRPDIRQSFAKRLDEASEEIKRRAGIVSATEQSIAFIGDIGVGKTTAICALTGLEIERVVRRKKGQETKQDPVLYTGAGGSTICEVHLVQGQAHGIIIKPRSPEEIGVEVREFAYSIKPLISSEDDQSIVGTSAEMERAIRNMSQLNIRRPLNPDGTRGHIDPAKDLADELSDYKELASRILAKMDIQKRQRTEIQYSGVLDGQSALEWLRDTFAQINNGRHPEFSIPESIEVALPNPVLAEKSFSLRIVDTKGIDQTAERKDLTNHINSPDTAVVLCSPFNNAPATSLQSLLEMASDRRVADLEDKTAVLVLPKHDEALAVKDDFGEAVDGEEEGYKLKSEQVEARLNALNVPGIRVEFFNSIEDNAEEFEDFLLSLGRRLRENHCRNLEESISDANDLVANYANEQVREVQRQAAGHLKAWVVNNSVLEPFSRKLEDGLFNAMRSVHVSSVRASVRRQGNWHNLEYAFQLGNSTASMARQVLAPKERSFKTITANLLQNPELKEAAGLVRQAENILSIGVESIIEDCNQHGISVHRDMEYEHELWDRSDGEWGKGPGYRDRVIKHHEGWFDIPNEVGIDASSGDTVDVRKIVEDGWHRTLTRLSNILGEN